MQIIITFGDLRPDDPLFDSRQVWVMPDLKPLFMKSVQAISHLQRLAVDEVKILTANHVVVQRICTHSEQEIEERQRHVVVFLHLPAQGRTWGLGRFFFNRERLADDLLQLLELSNGLLMVRFDDLDSTCALIVLMINQVFKVMHKLALVVKREVVFKAFREWIVTVSCRPRTVLLVCNDDLRNFTLIACSTDDDLQLF